jgi:hypothetical protein
MGAGGGTNERTSSGSALDRDGATAEEMSERTEFIGRNTVRSGWGVTLMNGDALTIDDKETNNNVVVNAAAALPDRDNEIRFII